MVPEAEGSEVQQVLFFLKRNTLTGDSSVLYIPPWSENCLVGYYCPVGYYCGIVMKRVITPRYCIMAQRKYHTLYTHFRYYLSFNRAHTSHFTILRTENPTKL